MHQTGSRRVSALSLNSDQVQMVSFLGDGWQADFLGTGNAPWLSNEWVLAWEDLACYARGSSGAGASETSG